MPQIALNMYQTVAIAMMLFVLGRFLTNRVEFLRKVLYPCPRGGRPDLRYRPPVPVHGRYRGVHL